MAKKVFIGVGHGGSDPGAVANGKKEKSLALDVAKTIKAELKRHGVSVGMSRSKDENDPINEEVRECNAFNPDLAVDIHFNAGGGDGAEVFHSIVGGLGKTLAKNILAEMVKIGQNSRGAKTKKGSNGKDYYAFVRDTKCDAVIVECAFIDNKKDIKIADTTKERKIMGVAIAKGILKTLGIKYMPEDAFEPYRAKVTVASLNIRKGAGKKHDVVGRITDSGIYTIIEESDGFGKLKSGAGWISLDYCKKV